MEPVELIKRVKEIQEESSRAEMRNPRSATARKKYAAELSERLKQLKGANATKNQQDVSGDAKCRNMHGGVNWLGWVDNMQTLALFF